jgi:hypothetical protein
MRRHPNWIVPALLLALPMALSAQEPTPLAVGAPAPAFALTGATRYGVLKAPVHLSDFAGQTVVLAFFYKARTKG